MIIIYIILGLLLTIIGGAFLSNTVYNLSQIPEMGLEFDNQRTMLIKLTIVWFIVTASGIYIIGYQLIDYLNL